MVTLPFLIIAALQCAPTINHVPDADVAYQPSLNEDGWTVAPADIGKPAIDPKQFDSVDVDLNIPLSDYISNPAFQNQFPFAQIDVGDVEVNQHAPSRFNGETMGDTQTLPCP